MSSIKTEMLLIFALSLNLKLIIPMQSCHFSSCMEIDQKRIKKNKPATDRGPFLCLLHAHAHWSNLLLPRQQLTSPLLEQQLHLNSSFFIPKEIICLSHRIISKIQEFKTFKNKVTKMLNLTKTSFAHYDIVN